ncbi:hypothetical protein [Undibacterium sp.]|jgi:hypothetical protein|uniref:hypothetical protein n=1 Tax=Undibacterium sp. TaxID=1914977 RepID=UPI0025E9AC36|nr:hypothetical protein [Undibacterium sp.]
MNQLAIISAIVLLLSACSTPVSEQVRRLQSAACCATPQDLRPVETISSERSGELSESSSIISIDAGRAPAIALRLPEGSNGRILEIHATPDMGAVTRGGSLIFAPVSIAFITADGKTIAPSEDSGINPAHGGALYSFILARQVRVPQLAVSAVFYSDPSKIGTSQTMAHKTSSYLMPAGGLLIPMTGRSSVTAIYAVYGKFSVQLLNPKN